MIPKKFQKRGQVEVLWFILKLIIAVTLFVAFVGFVYKIFFAGASSEGITSFESIADAIQSCKEGQPSKKEMVFDDGVTWMFIRAGKQQATLTESPGALYASNRVDHIFKRPEQCLDQGCACLCQKNPHSDINADKPDTYFDLPPEVAQKEYIWACDKLYCKSLGNIQFPAETKVIRFTDLPVRMDKDITAWHDGYLFMRISHFENIRRNVLTIECYRNTVALCTSNFCFGDDDIKKIDLEIIKQDKTEAIAQFQDFREDFDRCVHDLSCTQISLTMPANFRVLHAGRIESARVMLTSFKDNQGETYTPEIIDDPQKPTYVVGTNRIFTINVETNRPHGFVIAQWYPINTPSDGTQNRVARLPNSRGDKYKYFLSFRTTKPGNYTLRLLYYIGATLYDEKSIFVQSRSSEIIPPFVQSVGWIIFKPNERGELSPLALSYPSNYNIKVGRGSSSPSKLSLYFRKNDLDIFSWQMPYLEQAEYSFPVNLVDSGDVVLELESDTGEILGQKQDAFRIANFPWQGASLIAGSVSENVVLQYYTSQTPNAPREWATIFDAGNYVVPRCDDASPESDLFYNEGTTTFYVHLDDRCISFVPAPVALTP